MVEWNPGRMESRKREDVKYYINKVFVAKGSGGIESLKN